MQCLAERKRVLRIHGIVAEKTIKIAMNIIGAGLGHNIDGSTSG